MSRSLSFFDRLVDGWFAWMAAMSWQVGVLVAALAIIGFLLKRRSARFRYGLWMLVPIRLVLPPTLALATCWAWWVLPSQREPGEMRTTNTPLQLQLHRILLLLGWEDQDAKHWSTLPCITNAHTGMAVNRHIHPDRKAI